MSLIDTDKQWLLSVNGSESLFLDNLATTLTTATTWIPLYVMLLFLVIRNSGSAKKVAIIVLCALLCVFLAGSLDDMIVKPLVARWRPARDPDIGISVDIVDGYRGGRFGFFSAHASNTFSLAVFFMWLVRSRLLSISLAAWSLLNCWTRMYLGVHYPGDIVVGLLWGAIVGSAVWYLCIRIVPQHIAPSNYVSEKYTSTGFQRDHIDSLVVVLLLTLCYAIIKSCIVIQ